MLSRFSVLLPLSKFAARFGYLLALLILNLFVHSVLLAQGSVSQMSRYQGFGTFGSATDAMGGVPQPTRPSLGGQATRSPSPVAEGSAARTLSPVRTLRSPSQSQPAIPAEAFAGSDAALAQVNGAQDSIRGDQKDAFAPITAYQRYVEQSTGRLVPVFGMDFFAATKGFAPIEDSPVPADYMLGPGDELVLSISGMLEANLRLVIDRHGQIQIPKLGLVSVQGVMASKIEDHIQKALAKYFRDFQLSVTLGRLRTLDIYVVGEALRPGKWTVSSMTSMVNALFSVGGPSPSGSMRQIKLRRNDQLIGNFDLYRFIRNGETDKDQRLQSGDVIIIPPINMRVALVGQSDRSAIYELSETEQTLGGLLEVASIQRQLINVHRVVIERINPTDPNAPLQVLEKSLKGLDLATPLIDGDIIRLFEIAPRFSNAVTLRGNVAAPLRYPHFPGMRLSDLIPEVAALMEPAYFLRKNRLVQFEDGQNGELERTTNATDEIRGRRPLSVTGFRDRLSEPHWEYAVIERISSKDLKPQIIPFSLRKLLIVRDSASNSLLEPGDVVTIFSKSDFSIPKADVQRLVRVEGEVLSPGVYPVDDRASPDDAIRLAGGLTKSAYLYGTEFSRESVRIDQQKNLESVKQRLRDRSASLLSEMSQNIDPSQTALLKEKFEASRVLTARIDALKASGRLSMRLSVDSTNLPAISLENGDRIYVPARPASVNVFGAVNIESSLIYQPGRTVSDYLSLAGLRTEADRNEIFVLRADGSVLSNQDSRAFFRLGSSVDAEQVYPGDSIVVPEKLDKESAFTVFMRSARDFATVFGQLGIGASAIKILRQ